MIQTVSSRRRLHGVALAILLAVAAVAHAQDTGSISGLVVDERGQPLTNTTIRLTGERLPTARTTVTGSTGVYRFDLLIPGEYRIAADGVSTRTAAVELGRDTQVDLVAGLTVSDTVVVDAVRPIVDTRSTEAAFNVGADTLARLPIERTFRGLFQLAPGVADNRSRVGPAAGGSRQDNAYLVDGANITNPGFGYLGTEVNQFDIEEVNLKRAGMTAEFGRTAGMVVNAVSRTGSNRFSLMARVDWLTDRLVSDYSLPDDLLAAGVQPGAFRDALLTTHVGPAIGIGGPLVTDRVFYYGSGRFVRERKWDRVNKVGTALPDEVRQGPELFAKVTTVATPNQLLNISYRHRPNDVEQAGLTADHAPSNAATTDNSTRIGTVEWSAFLPVRRTLNVRYLYMKENNEDAPLVDLGYLPAFDPQRLEAMGQFTDPARANLIVGAAPFASVQNYSRHELRATFTQPFEARTTRHVLKAGFGYEFGDEVLDRTTNGWGSIVTIVQNNVPALRARYFTRQSPQVAEGRTWSMFLQDEMTLGARVSVNAGVLLNRDEFSQTVAGSGGCPATVTLKGGAAVYESTGDTCRFLRFGFGDEVQPRLGVAYQLRQQAGDKLYGNWARFYNLDQKSSGRSLAPARIFQTQTVFDLAGNVLSSGPLASTTGKMIDPAINPIYSDEWLGGYATPLAGGLALEAFVVSRSMHNFIEDVPSRLSGTAPDAGPFVAVNLPCVTFAACQQANARRVYRAATIDLRGQSAAGWTANVNYTWSRFEGNHDLDYTPVTTSVSVFNTSSFIQDAPGTNVEDPNRDGPLMEDRPHVVKVFSSYPATEALTVSGYFRLQSGTPWAARGRDWAGSVLNYLEPAGSHRNPAWANLDLMAIYRLPLAGRTRVSLEARLLNVFNNQTRLSTDVQQFLDLRTLPAPPYFAPYQVANPFFGTGNVFAPPRRLHLGLTATF